MAAKKAPRRALARQAKEMLGTHDVRDLSRNWQIVSAHILGRAPTVEASTVGPEPQELATWRKLIAYRDRLLRAATHHDDEQQVGFLAEAFKSRGATPAQIATMSRRFRQSMADDARKAIRLIKALDAAIDSRTTRSGPPDKLIETLGLGRLRAAVDAVVAWLANENESEAVMQFDAWLALCAVAKDPTALLPDHSVKRLAEKARKTLHASGRYRRHADVARWMVAEVAGLPKNSRSLR